MKKRLLYQKEIELFKNKNNINFKSRHETQIYDINSEKSLENKIKTYNDNFKRFDFAKVIKFIKNIFIIS